ncbi:TIGR03767 family metallophosphoesterase [Nocardioides sp.]|uniref:TIGR03767 family metallophosphoesterase n=1 Tax=Nocardioides sp. TaxID=35761 RepID=UPI003782D3B6
MQLSRRDLIRSSLVVGGAAALGGLGSLSADAVAGTGAAARLAPRTAGGTTTRRTVLGKGPAGDGGWRAVVERPGEPWVVRGGLGAVPSKSRRSRRRGLLAFAQLSDIHVVDAQSPMRLEYGESLSSSAYRPQEVFSGHVADAMVRALNDIGTGPVTGRKLAFAIQTGDNSDSRQYNEIRWNIDVLDGEMVTVDSGDLTKYEGVMDQNAASYMTGYWHPDGTPEGKVDDDPRSKYGFPEIPGVLDAARLPFQAEGLAMDWYTAMGNHDGLIQGNFPANDIFRARAIGDVKPISGVDSRTVTADPDRRIIDRDEWVQEHFNTTGTPVGHGFTQKNLDDDTAYYTFDRGIVRFIVLDTVLPAGEQGTIDAAQLTWLKKQLAASRKRLVVLASHHPLESFKDPKLATQVTNLLLGYDNVIAWVNGHTHDNNIWPHVRKDKRTKKVVGGFWEINTASHIDWPQQSRIIEIADNRDGTLSIFTTMVDHGGTLEWDGDLTNDEQLPLRLAGLSRLLGANDWQERDDNRRGRRVDRNVELVMKAPAFLR